MAQSVPEYTINPTPFILLEQEPSLLPCTTFLLRFTLHDFDRYCHYQADGDRSCTVLDIPSDQGPGYHPSCTPIAMPSDMLDSLGAWAGVIRSLIDWRVSKDCIMSLLPDIYTCCKRSLMLVIGDEEEDDDRHHGESSSKMLSICVHIKRIVAVKSNLDRSGRVAGGDGDLARVVDRMNDEDCPICLEGLVGSRAVRQLPCYHLFHGSCVRQWLQKNQTCPLCRCELPAIRF